MTGAGRVRVVWFFFYMTPRSPTLETRVLSCIPYWLWCLLLSPFEISHSLPLMLLFRTWLFPSSKWGQCHWTSEAWSSREKGEVIIFLSKFLCSGVPLMFTAKANFLRRSLGTRNQNQVGEVLLSSLELCQQFRPLWIVYSHSFHLFSLGGFSWCLALHRDAPVVTSSFYYPVLAGREAGYAETDIAYSLLGLWMKENGIPLNEWGAVH